MHACDPSIELVMILIENVLMPFRRWDQLDKNCDSLETIWIDSPVEHHPKAGEKFWIGSKPNIFRLRTDRRLVCETNLEKIQVFLARRQNEPQKSTLKPIQNFSPAFKWSLSALYTQIVRRRQQLLSNWPQRRKGVTDWSVGTRINRDVSPFAVRKERAWTSIEF